MINDANFFFCLFSNPLSILQRERRSLKQFVLLASDRKERNRKVFILDHLFCVHQNVKDFEYYFGL